MKILLAGDSITEGFNISRYFDGMDVINKGVYGDNSLGLFKRLKSDVIDNQPDIIFILIGTNDFAMGRGNDEIADSIENIIKELIEDLPDAIIYLTSILPVRQLENRNNDDINYVNAKLKYLTKRLSINYYDLNGIFLDNNNEISTEDSIDGLHLTEVGYGKWAVNLTQLIEEF